MLEEYEVLYYSFLKSEDKSLYRDVIKTILRELPPQAKAAIISVQNKLTAKKLTEEGKSRKKKNNRETLLQRN